MYHFLANLQKSPRMHVRFVNVAQYYNRMMTTNSDSKSLSAFVRTRSHDAFAAMVRRYADLVYGTARRMVGDDHLAQDVTQTTFMVLAKKARFVDPRTLPGWLVK